jgi:hypothetical protein
MTEYRANERISVPFQRKKRERSYENSPTPIIPTRVAKTIPTIPPTTGSSVKACLGSTEAFSKNSIPRVLTKFTGSFLKSTEEEEVFFEEDSSGEGVGFSASSRASSRGALIE